LNPPNRWTCVGSANETDWVAIDLGTPRRVDTVKLYLLDDGTNVLAPARYEVEWLDGKRWKAIPGQQRAPGKPEGHRANVVKFAARNVQKLRVSLTHAPAGRSGLTELEVWGNAIEPYAPAQPPKGNLALNMGTEFPKATASFSDGYGGEPEKALDG